ncbi:hypothetical protein RF11_04380 [Thelohanellus kitauei]|uniref:Uncharacterized protein n=1 Tax=Thelohanellus kitauei TaxID=669202 RepID=A0A0C2MVT5_THEKT|nr:hypothetical protein RF11_04380 [Thelohanellus kitauei]
MFPILDNDFDDKITETFSSTVRLKSTLPCFSNLEGEQQEGFKNSGVLISNALYHTAFVVAIVVNKGGSLICSNFEDSVCKDCRFIEPVWGKNQILILFSYF